MFEEIKFSINDLQKIEEIEKVRENNFFIFDIFSKYLVNCPRAIDKNLLSNFKFFDNTQQNLVALFCAICNLDRNQNEYHKYLIQTYIEKSIKPLSTSDFTNNTYYKNILLPSIEFKNWSFKNEVYKPFELFVYNDVICDNQFKEFPQIGYFEQEFCFPAITENQNEWMLITPNEINTMQSAIDTMTGKVVCFGLGLGYIQYMLSQKQNIESITIIERDKNACDMFESFILPKFAYKQKIKIICTDAYKYLHNEMKTENFDFAFFDLWHDSYDGLIHYLKIKKYENSFLNTRFLYWIEKSILSRFRWQIFEELQQLCKMQNNNHTLLTCQEKEIISSFLQDEKLKEIAKIY